MNPAVATIPEDAREAFKNGLAHFEHSDWQKAAAAFQHTILLAPDYVEAYYNMGIALRKMGQYPEAIAAYQAAAALDPNDPDISYNLGNALFAAGKTDEAVEHYQRTLYLKPSFSKARNNLAVALKECGRIDAAIAQYNAALNDSPSSAEALCRMGNLLYEQQKFGDAEEWYQKALQQCPDCAEAFNGLGNLFRERNRLQEARVCYEQAIRAAPGCARAYSNLAKICQEIGDTQNALRYYDQAIQIKGDEADIRFNRAIAYLINGDFAKGWREYDYRFKRSRWKSVYAHRFSKPRWNGSAFVGKCLFVHSEQGLGDTLQFVRYLPMVARRGGEVIFETHPALASLLSGFPGVSRLTIGIPEKRPEETFDFYVPLLSLPGIFGTTVATIPADVPYIFPDARKKSRWQRYISNFPGYRVGIVWGASATDPKRCCSLDDFVMLRQIPGLQLIGLQVGADAGQTLELTAGETISNLGPYFTDFSETAAAIDCLDLVISVDTAVAHLAGAMGKPVWTLLPYAPDWRWMLHRNDSPWYPTMRLFRQEKPGNWHTVMQQVATALKRAIAQPAV